MNTRRFFCLRGYMKSGTNWVGALLSSHPEISCVGEFHWEAMVNRFDAWLKSHPMYESLDSQELARRRLEEMIQNCIADEADPAATLIGDRTPHTILPLTLQNAPHISVIRDGRDVLVSRAFHLYNQPSASRLFQRIPEMAESYAEFQKDPWFFNKNPERLLCHEVMVRESIVWWRDHVESDREAVERYPDLDVCFVRYEDLHRDILSERVRMLEFLGVDPARAAPLTELLAPGFGKERPAEFLRKGTVGDWRNYFTEQTKNWFKDDAGETLVEFGYVNSMDW